MPGLQGRHAVVQMRLSSGTGGKRRLQQRVDSMQPTMPAQLSGVLMWWQKEELRWGSL